MEQKESPSNFVLYNVKRGVGIDCDMPMCGEEDQWNHMIKCPFYETKLNEKLDEKLHSSGLKRKDDQRKDAANLNQSQIKVEKLCLNSQNKARCSYERRSLRIVC